jgi:sulfur relay (sulfurtransferase) DsrC/TusE family protein
MTEQEREELIEQMARRIDAFIKDTTDWRKVLAVEIAKNLCIDKKDFDTLEWGAKDYFLTQARAALAVAEPVIREQCAKIIEPSFPRPCDCEDCYCGNRDDAERVAAWDEATANAKAIREGRND